MSAAEKEQTAAAGTVRVSVPATSANLGVGFDVLGLALDLSAEFTFEPADALKIDGCAPKLAGEDNLVWTSYLCGCREFGLEAQPLHITESCTIPASAPHAWLRALRQLKRLRACRSTASARFLSPPPSRVTPTTLPPP